MWGICSPAGADPAAQRRPAEAAGPPGANARLLPVQGLHYCKLSHHAEQRKLSALFAFQTSSGHSDFYFFFNAFHNSNTAWLMK